MPPVEKEAVAPGLGYSQSHFDKGIYLRSINLTKMVFLVNVHIHKLKHDLDIQPSYPLPIVHSPQITIKRGTARLCPCVLVTDGEKKEQETWKQCLASEVTCSNREEDTHLRDCIMQDSLEQQTQQTLHVMLRQL